MSEQTPTEPLPSIQPMPQGRSRPIRRCGCWLGLLIWIGLLISPCFLCVLATQEEINVSLGNAPGQSLRIWLLNEADRRGIGVSFPGVFPAQEENALCIQTDVRFVLWMGEGEPSTYCDCYSRNNETEWTLISSNARNCSA